MRVINAWGVVGLVFIVFSLIDFKQNHKKHQTFENEITMSDTTMVKEYKKTMRTVESKF